MPGIFRIHSVFHLKHPIARGMSTSLNYTLLLVIEAVNKIKGNLHKENLFRQLYQENGEYFELLLFHTMLRWLF